MTLSEILGRGVSMEWHEGVAIVRGVAACLLATPGEPSHVPELNQIEISEEGKVSLAGKTIAGEPVRHLGQLLQATLGNTQVPVQLRLLVVSATAPSPTFGSIREYDEALAFFDRPDRDAVLQALYSRAAAAPVSGSGSQTLDAVAPLPTEEPLKAAHKRASARSKPSAGKIAIGAIVLLVGVAAAWYASRVGFAASSSNESVIALESSDAPGATAVVGRPVSSERTGREHLVPVGGVSGQPAATSGTSAAKPATVAQTVPALNPSAEAIAIDPNTVSDSGSAMAASIGDVPASPGGTAAEATEDDGGPIFSRDSAGVSPPVGVRPQVPRELPPNVKPEQLCRIDLIVSETGSVESVKLLGTHCRVHDSMFLSAVKAWQFRPALRDGKPVRFRKSVWMASE